MYPRQRRYRSENVVDNWDEAHKLAVEYLRAYSGNWGVLVGIRDMLDDDGSLTVDLVRITLNSMLGDPQVKNMPEFPRKVFDAGAGGKPALNSSSIFDNEQVPSIPVEPPLRITVKGHWNRYLGVAVAKHATSIHLIDRTKTPFLWELNRKTGVRTPVLHLYWSCSPYTRKERNTKLITNDDAVQLLVNGGWNMCAGCAGDDPKFFERIRLAALTRQAPIYLHGTSPNSLLHSIELGTPNV